MVGEALGAYDAGARHWERGASCTATGLDMTRLARNIGIMLGAYLLAWGLAFVLVAGFRADLVATYFQLGWSFSGLEAPTYVWLLAWPLFGAILLARHPRIQRRST
jgi:hypothetical protein